MSRALSRWRAPRGRPRQRETLPGRTSSAWHARPRYPAKAFRHGASQAAGRRLPSRTPPGGASVVHHPRPQQPTT